VPPAASPFEKGLDPKTDRFALQIRQAVRRYRENKTFKISEYLLLLSVKRSRYFCLLKEYCPGINRMKQAAFPAVERNPPLSGRIYRQNARKYFTIGVK
jgi:hypothetical protein